MTKDPTCEQRVESHRDSRLQDIRLLWMKECGREDEIEEEDRADLDDLGEFNDYGLSFDYVPSGTFNDQEEGYFRYQISWGGPSEEFRFFCDADKALHRIEFWFLDWFDGASRRLHGKDYKLMSEIFDMLKECGTVDHVLKEARG